MNAQVNLPAEEKVTYKKRRQLPDIWRRFRKNRRAVVGLIIMVVIILAGIAAPVITPCDPTQQNLREAYQMPSMAHWFGTDSIGRDLFTRVIYGIRTSLLCGVVAVVISLAIGGVLGPLPDTTAENWTISSCALWTSCWPFPVFCWPSLWSPL